jgi:hypothetical protein
MLACLADALAIRLSVRVPAEFFGDRDRILRMPLIADAC